MNLFDLTKKLSKQIDYYDKLSKRINFDYKNPFWQKKPITVIWIDEENKRY